MLEHSSPDPFSSSMNDDSMESHLADLLAEYLTSLENGVPLELDQLIARYPHMEDEIRDLTVSVDILHSATLKYSEEEVDTAIPSHAKSLGDFEILQEIGRGGMGVVYEARQISLDRKVALKVLPFASTLDEKQVARFRNEAQAAAQLQHPGIVPVFAIGQERGVQYYAMQFVSGRSLQEVIRALDSKEHSPQETLDIATLSTHADASAHEATMATSNASRSFPTLRDFYRRIAELGLQAAQALHYAHECGVVHRDIKPSNLLLDSQGKLWITDFGLARVKDSPGVTVTGDVVGTLRYMSPEQASGRSALVDHRTDVYALGATLYEMLTLQPAHPGEDRRAVQRAVELEEPTPPRVVNPEIPVDLETIVLTAMEKTRDERYATAEDLAEDLNRYLLGKPTLARRPTIIDRGTKWLRRHRHLALASCLILVTMSAISTVGAVMLAKETAEKEAALVRSEENLQQARMVVDRFGKYFSRELESIPGSEAIRQELLQDTLDYYKQFIVEAEDKAELRVELATTAFKAGETSKRLGKTQQAHQFFTLAMKTFDDLETTTTNTEYLQQRAACLNEMALLEIKRGDVLPARKKLEAAIELLAELKASEEESSQPRVAQAEMLMNLGLLDNRVGRTANAEVSLQQAISILEELTIEYPDEPSHRHDAAIAMSNLSFVQQQSDLGSASESAQTAVDILEELLADEEYETSLESRFQEDLALCYNNLGAIQSHLGRHVNACRLHQKAIELQEHLCRQSPAVVDYQTNLAVSFNNLGQAFTQADDFESSNEAFQRARDILQESTEDHPADIALQSSLAGVLNNQAMSLEHVGELDAALELLELAVQCQKLAVERAPQVVAYRQHLSTHYANYGRVLRKLNRIEDAVQIANEHLQVWPLDGEHKYRVARELSHAASVIVPGSEREELRLQIIGRAVDLLEEAYTAKNRPRTEPIYELEFASLSNDKRFGLLIHRND